MEGQHVSQQMIEELMATALQKVNGNKQSLAAEVDGRIRSNAKHFVQFGLDLMLMRDGQLYRDLPGHSMSSFADYVRTVEELTERHARRTINASLVYQCIERGDNNVPPPATANQVFALIDADIVNFEQKEREVTNADGNRQVIKQTVGIKNPKTVAGKWEQVCREWEKYREQYKAENDGKEPRPISYTFIRKQLPGGEKLARSKDTQVYASLGRNLAKWTQALQAARKKYKGDVRKLIVAEKWTPQHMDSLHGMMLELWTELNEWMEGMTDD